MAQLEGNPHADIAEEHREAGALAIAFELRTLTLALLYGEMTPELKGIDYRKVQREIKQRVGKSNV